VNRREARRSLLPDDEDARRLRDNTTSLAEFLAGRSNGRPGPDDGGRRLALLHGHCHAKSLWGLEAERKLLAAPMLKPGSSPTGSVAASRSAKERDVRDVMSRR
jgi:hypothetical protein